MRENNRLTNDVIRSCFDWESKNGEIFMVLTYIYIYIFYQFQNITLKKYLKAYFELG